MQRAEPTSTSQPGGVVARRLSGHDATLEVQSCELEVLDLRLPMTRWLSGGPLLFASLTFVVGTAVLLAADAMVARSSWSFPDLLPDRAAALPPSAPSAETRALLPNGLAAQAAENQLGTEQSLLPETVQVGSAPQLAAPVEAAATEKRTTPTIKAKLRMRAARAKRDRARTSASLGARSTANADLAARAKRPVR